MDSVLLRGLLPCKFFVLYLVYSSVITSNISRRTRNPLDYRLTNSMEQSPSWETNSFSASQINLHILCNPKVHFCIHKSPPPVPILSHINPVHAPPVPILSQLNPVHAPHSYFFNIRFSIILPSKLGFSKLLFPSGFPTKTLFAPLPHTCYIPSPFCSSWFDHPNNIWWGIQNIKLHVM